MRGLRAAAAVRELAERFIHRTLELLFPHFAAEVSGRAGAVADELASLRTMLVDALRLPEAHCADPDAVVERFFSALPDVRAVLLLDAQAICDGDDMQASAARAQLTQGRRRGAGVGLTAGGLLAAALRTGRATSTASGSP